MPINHKKTPVLESLLNKFARLSYLILLEFTRVSCWFNFRNHIQSNLKLHRSFLDPINRKRQACNLHWVLEETDLLILNG